MPKHIIKLLIIFCFLLLPVNADAADFAWRGFNDNFILKFQEQTFELKASDILSARGTFEIPKNSNLIYISPEQSETNYSFFSQTPKPNNRPMQTLEYNPKQIYEFVQSAVKTVERTAVEPVLEIKNNKAIKFVPPEDGVEVDSLAATLNVLSKLKNQESETDIIYSTSSPKTLLGKTNNLGIKELVARGVSNFKGSPKNRRHNIKVGVEKFTGLIIAQGEEFSFNKYLGPVEEEEGFLPELVIKKTGTVPELGGGLCQVSSTTFRAAMNAGLPITQRKNHSYAVQYYAPQGTDATIYPGVIDLKFINDTEGAILVWPHLEGKDDLIFDFYGTKDERIVDLKKPYQYDRKSDGSLKAEWTRVVTKDGITSTSTFKSVYQPPALFHKEEEFVSAPITNTPAPSPTPSAIVN